MEGVAATGSAEAGGSSTLTLFAGGDVMTGRGIDQVLPHPSDPALHELYVRSAVDYLRLAEDVNGPVPVPVDWGYIWGDALAEIEARADCRIVNLETSVTTSDDAEPKGINYRMNPDNVACLEAAGIDCCVLANNHMLDWGRAGLVETLEVLHGRGIATAGAGRDEAEAARPAVLEAWGDTRVLVFGVGFVSSGIPMAWRAEERRPGVRVFREPSAATADAIAEQVHAERRPGDIVVVSVHWGENWGYAVPAEQRAFAHQLIDAGGADVVHGHSSHHPKGVEVYRDRLVLYGCGDLVNDYEGISGHGQFRSDLVLAFFLTVEAGSGALRAMDMLPFRTVRLRLQRAEGSEAEWLRGVMEREGSALGTHTQLAEDGALELRW